MENVTTDGDNVAASSLDIELLIVSIVYGLTFVIGIIGNSLIVYSVIQFTRMKSVSNMFLSSLATADLILIIFCIPVKFAQLFSYTWTLGAFTCKAIFYVQNLSAMCSVFTLTAISIERYYAIMYPIECRSICTMSQAKRVIVLTWLASLLLATPVLYVQILFKVGIEPDIGYWCVRNWEQPMVWRGFELYTMILILVIPGFIMSYSYGRICNRLRSVMRERTVTFAMSHKSNSVYIDAPASKMSQVIRMLIVVVIVFAICWSPILILNVLTAFELAPALNYGHMKAVRTALHLLSYANSCVNPIIYGFMSENFRSSFREAILKCFGRDTNERRNIQEVTNSFS